APGTLQPGRGVSRGAPGGAGEDRGGGVRPGRVRPGPQRYACHSKEAICRRVTCTPSSRSRWEPWSSPLVTGRSIPSPRRLTPADPVQYFALRIPDSLEIRAVDFDAALYPNVSGSNNTWVDTKLGGRAFVKVHAVHRRTGEQ